MNCPHCRKAIEISPTEWRIWYRDDVRMRIIAQTGNRSIAELVAPHEADGPAGKAIRAVEDMAGAVCLAYGRGQQAKPSSLKDWPPERVTVALSRDDANMITSVLAKRNAALAGKFVDAIGDL